jgi:predicted O-methyltransferase YrrM
MLKSFMRRSVVSKIERNWQYAEQFPVETEFIARARRTSLELGIEPVSASVAAHLTSIVTLTGAKSICELGTGAGVSGLSLLRHNERAHLTSIDVEEEYHRNARQLFAHAGIASARLRLIVGDAHQVLPRLNTDSYDLLVIDADPEGLIEYVEHGLQVVRPGGTIVVPNALWRGRVADPAARDEVTTTFRDLLQTVADSPAIVPNLSPAGDGVLTLTRLTE